VTEDGPDQPDGAHVPDVVEYESVGAPRPPLGQRLRGWVNRKSIAAVGVGVVVAAYVAGLAFGRGGRAFFSPDSLDNRTQSEILLPLTELPLYRSRYVYYRYPLTDYLVSKGYWSARATDSPQWVSMFHWNEQWRDGYSTFHREFASRGGEWIKWSDAHPDIAGDLWGRVLRMMRDDEPYCHQRVRGLLMYAHGCSDIGQYRDMLKLFEEPIEVADEPNE
jgi:hypothetical protein